MLSKFARIAAVGAAITIPIGAYAFIVRPWSRKWGVDATEAATVMAGDDLVTDATDVDTRGIDIDALPQDVWPWLVQMGYGKAGFYSYDHLDTTSASSRQIVPEWQHLEVGGTVPTYPAGGFAVKVVEPERALVLYVDSAMALEWAKREAAAVEGAGAPPPGVQASGAFLGTTMPAEFSGTWAIVLRRQPDGGTRLVERMRFRFGVDHKPGMKLAHEALGFGMLLMMRKQMLGIRDRAEALAASKVPAPFLPPFEAAAPA